MTRTLMAAAILALLATTEARAQERMPAVGDRVRITSPAGARLKGELVAVRSDTLVVVSEGTLRSVAVPLSQVDRIEVRRQRTGMEGLGVGLLHGVPIGFVSGYALGERARRVEGATSAAACSCIRLGYRMSHTVCLSMMILTIAISLATSATL